MEHKKIEQPTIKCIKHIKIKTKTDDGRNVYLHAKRYENGVVLITKHIASVEPMESQAWTLLRKNNFYSSYYQIMSFKEFTLITLVSDILK
jgi:hypothetical protein